jgi:hypothetical protein
MIDWFYMTLSTRLDSELLTSKTEFGDDAC